MGTENREPESATVALVEEMHFVGKVDGFCFDLDAEEGWVAGAQAPTPYACCC